VCWGEQREIGLGLGSPTAAALAIGAPSSEPVQVENSRSNSSDVRSTSAVVDGQRHASRDAEESPDRGRNLSQFSSHRHAWS
jgi:hypothetical protein